ncbi:MAG: response regulator transcription factor [Clostridiales bacterium]|nr:response regulator transcription factor [Clostridiales bacterium]
MKHKIMVVDDAAELRDVLRLYLENAGYEVVEAVNGFDALKCLESHNIDLMILDIMMPNMDGFELLRHLDRQEKGRDFPIIFLSARTQVHDKIRGLTLGADDYIEKPYDPGEVIARVMVALRRTQQQKPEVPERITVGDLSWDVNSRLVYQMDKPLELRAKEYQILTLFMKHPGRVYTKKEIYEYLWDEPYYNDDNTIMVHISNLRDKIEVNPKQPEKIITIRGLGYMLKKEK